MVVHPVACEMNKGEIVARVERTLNGVVTSAVAFGLAIGMASAMVAPRTLATV